MSFKKNSNTPTNKNNENKPKTKQEVLSSLNYPACWAAQLWNKSKRI